MTIEPTLPPEPRADDSEPRADAAEARADALEPPAPAQVPPAFVPVVAVEESRPSPAPPRVRWAGIVWGAVFALLAGAALWLLAEASRLQAVQDWLRALSPGDIHPGWVIGIVALAGGVLLLVLGGVALLRNAQLRATVER